MLKQEHYTLKKEDNSTPLKVFLTLNFSTVMYVQCCCRIWSKLTLSEKRYKSWYWGGTFSKDTLLYLKGAFVPLRYQYAPFRYKCTF